MTIKKLNFWSMITLVICFHLLVVTPPSPPQCVEYMVCRLYTCCSVESYCSKHVYESSCLTILHFTVLHGLLVPHSLIMHFFLLFP